MDTRRNYLAWKRKDGFTLLELLAAMAMMVVLSASLYSSLYIAFKAKSSVERSLGPIREMQLVLHTLKTDITSAMISENGLLAGTFIGTDGMNAGGYDSDIVEFYKSNYVPYSSSNDADLVKEELMLMPQTNSRRMLLVRRIYKRQELASTTEDPEEEVITREINHFNLRYYDGEDWLDSWDSTTVENLLPQAIELSIGLELSEEEQFFSNSATYDNLYVISTIFPMPCAKDPDAVDVIENTASSTDGGGGDGGGDDGGVQLEPDDGGGFGGDGGGGRPGGGGARPDDEGENNTPGGIGR